MDMPTRFGILLLILLGPLLSFAQTEVIVEFASTKTLEAARKNVSASHSRAQTGGQDQTVWYTLQSAGDRNIAVVTSAKTVSDWKSMPGILSVRVATPLGQRTRTPNDPSFAEQWDMEQIEAPAAWEYATGGTSFSGREIVVGVIELAGFQLDHPDLQDNIFNNAEEIPGDGIDNDNNGLVDDINGWNYFENASVFNRDSHGTKVMGTLGAKGNNDIQAAGVNWDISMLPLVIGNSDLNWVKALDYLTTLRAKYNATNGAEGAYVVAANMSIGFQSTGTCEDYQHLNDAFTRAGEAGVLCIGATSNNLENLDQTPDISSSCNSDYLVVVTASDKQDDIWRACGYSTTDVDIAAPGETYRTIEYVVSGNINDEFLDTSGATPHVTGAVALAYAINCPILDDISLVDPAGAALLVKDAILSTGDDAIGNAALSTSGKRLNVRKTIERLLEQDCLIGDMVVQFAAGQVAPSTLTDAIGDLSLIRTLSEEWNIHLYNSAGGAILDHVTALEDMSSIAAAEPNVRFFLRGRQPNDPVYPRQDNLDDMGVDDAWETIYGASGTPPPSRVVTAIFDQNFDLNSQDLAGRVFANQRELADNGIDDDENGYVDDNNGYNLSARSNDFSSGNHGRAVASIIAANANDGFGIAGLDWSGRVLPLQGNSLAQWIEGASYVADLRSAYNQSAGNEGALVVSYVTAQGGALLRQDGQVVSNVLNQLLQEGILTIGATINDETPIESDFPSSIAHPGLLNTAYAFKGDFDGDMRRFGESNLPIYLPADNSPYAQTVDGIMRLSGSSAASAIAAGSIALLYQTPCADFETQAHVDPSATATRFKRALYRSANRKLGFRNNIVQLSSAASQLAAACEISSSCTVLSLYPNPITTSGTFNFELVSSQENTTCPVSIYDPLGRVVFRQNLNIEHGYREVSLPTSALTKGLYYLTAGNDGEVSTYPFVRAD